MTDAPASTVRVSAGASRAVLATHAPVAEKRRGGRAKAAHGRALGCDGAEAREVRTTAAERTRLPAAGRARYPATGRLTKGISCRFEHASHSASWSPRSECIAPARAGSSIRCCSPPSKSRMTSRPARRSRHHAPTARRTSDAGGVARATEPAAATPSPVRRRSVRPRRRYVRRAGIHVGSTARSLAVFVRRMHRGCRPPRRDSRSRRPHAHRFGPTELRR
jgi:hypothetical protein